MCSPALFRRRAVLFLAVLTVLTLLWPAAARAGRVYHGVSAGLLQVDQIDFPEIDSNQVPPMPYFPTDYNDNSNCIVSSILEINNFRAIKRDYFTNRLDEFGEATIPGYQWYNRADCYVELGPDYATDVNSGILLSSVAQNERNNYGTNSWPISTVHDSSPYRICSFASMAQVAGNGVEFNVNLAGAWFPYDQYIGALVRNSTRANGGTNDTLIGTPGLELDKHFTWYQNGRFIVDLTSFGINAQTDGVLLVNGGKDEQNYALAAVNPTNNGTWLVRVKDMSTPTFNNSEQDPIAWVFIPKTNTMLISGRFNGDGSISMFSGDAPQFTVRPMLEIGAGRWELKMNDYTPAEGVLIISAEAEGALNTDNIVTYEPTAAGDGWEIQSRDTPGMGLQTPVGALGEPEAVCSFVFVPASTPGVTVTPTENLLTSENGDTASFEVVLDAPPKADVTINVSSSDTTEGLVSPSALTFTASDWSTPQTVTVTGQDDALADGQISYTVNLAAATSADTNYNGLKPSDVSVLNADNEPGVTVSVDSVTTSEAGGQVTFSVVLNSAPTADVTIGVSSTDTTEGTIAPVSLTFTPSDWYAPQLVTVTSVDDLVVDGDVAYTIETAAAVSTDPAYSGFNVLNVAAVNQDNDTAGIAVTPTELSVEEPGTTATFTVVLGSQPVADVTVGYLSGDLSEGTIAPASATFTAANWNTPQTFTVTGVDDQVNDGNITFNFAGSVTSSDAVYAALVPAPILVITMDNEIGLTLPSGPAIYGIGTSGVGLDGWATVEDAVGNYNGATLTVTLTSSGTADDRLGIRSTGTETNQISVSAGTVKYGGTTIGTSAGGDGVNPLVVTLNSAATPAGVQALVRALMFSNVNSEPSLADRTVTVALARAGGASTASKVIKLGLVRATEFQQGADYGYGEYAGAADVELWATFPETAYPEGSSASGLGIGMSGLIPDRSVLLRFDNIIGDGPGQIPTNATIVYAELQIYVNNSGDGSPLYRMLIPWDENMNYLSSGDGYAYPDDARARSTHDSQLGVTGLSGSTGAGQKAFGVTPDVQAWARGDANYGWVMPAWQESGYDYMAFSPSEATNIVERPALRVLWVPEGTSMASFRYGVNGYIGAVDTRIRGGANANTEFSTSATMFPDYEVTTGVQDQEQVLLRFDDVVGDGEGQVPSGATIHAAMLDLAALFSNSPGAGGHFHAMLQPWEATNTWNDLGDGVQADGVQAVVAITAQIGDESLANVPGGYFAYEMTTDVQAWAYNQRPNYGWAILPWEFGRDGFGIGSAEQAAETSRPQLRVFYSPGTIPVPEDITLLSPVWNSTSVQVNFTGTAGKTYSVQRVGTLGGTWETRGTATTGTDGRATFTDSTPLAGAAFYRVIYP